MKLKTVFAIVFSAFLLFSEVTLAAGPIDPGVRGGPPGAGGPIPDIQVNEFALFKEGLLRANELESTCEACADIQPGTDNGQDPLLQTITNSAGLGARFNGDQCTICHSQPAIGGSGGFLVPNPQDPVAEHRRPENPMFDLIPHRKGQTNTVPSFIKQYGPIREARFILKPDGTPDGGVHQLFTVVGRTDDPFIPDCTAQVLPQPDFETQVKNKNIVFRIPLQLFGMGLIDSIQDREILARHAATAGYRTANGIKGMPNTSGNDGTITRFGWKAQNKSLTLFSGEAYNVEMGVTNELFPQATEENPLCNGPQKPHPNDVTRTATDDLKNEGFNNPLHIMSDWMQFSLFMRFLDAPQPADLTASAKRGQDLFGTGPDKPGIGCAACHTPQMRTAPVMMSAALQDKPVNLYSDLLVHNMGYKLADNITQGAAKGDMFRTTPLWGLGKRIFFMHDGRTDNLLEAIREHASPAGCNDKAGCPKGGYPPSEANTVIKRFEALSTNAKQAILDFLRSL